MEKVHFVLRAARRKSVAALMPRVGSMAMAAMAGRNEGGERAPAAAQEPQPPANGKPSVMEEEVEKGAFDLLRGVLQKKLEKL